jgi:hypothetical protein
MNKKPKFEYQKSREEYFNAIGKYTKKELMENMDQFVTIRNANLKAEKMDYKNMQIWREVNEMCNWCPYNGNDVFNGYYMWEKNKYEEELKKWEILKSNITLKRKLGNKRKRLQKQSYQKKKL